MKYLYIFEDGNSSQSDKEPTGDECLEIAEGNLTVIRFERGVFEAAEVSSEDVPDDENEEDGDTHEEWTIDCWTAV